MRALLLPALLPGLLLAAGLTFGLALAPSAHGQQGLRVVRVSRVRVDGALNDWRGVRFVSLGHGDDAALEYALGYDDDALYLAARVRDERVVRTDQPGVAEDAVILSLALPGRRGLRGTEVWLYPGVPGRRARAGVGSLGARPRVIDTITVVEGPLPRGLGYVIEARVPWPALGPTTRWDQGRGALRLRDVDREAHPTIETEPATAAIDPQHLGALPPLTVQSPETDNLEAFARERNLLDARPRYDLVGNVWGDGRRERVFVVDRYVVLTGGGYRDGGYGYHRLDVAGVGDVRSAELRDLTGDGLSELVLSLRQANRLGRRDLFQVVALNGEVPRDVFAVELGKETSAGRLTMELRIRPERGGPPVIEVEVGTAQGLDADSYRERPAVNAEPILLPWGPIRQRSYRWNGSVFARVGEVANPRYREATPATARATPVPTAEAAPAAPAGPSEDDLLAAFRQAQGVRSGVRPRFAARINALGDRRPERMEVYGKALVLVGPGIADGRRYLSSTFPVEDPADLLDVRTADVTGDRRSEILGRIQQRDGEVTRHVLVVYRVRETGIQQILLAEVRREQAGDFVENDVRTRGGRLQIRPGRARGFGADRWPFAPPSAEGAVAPLLLPWQDRPVTYRLVGDRLEPR
ncbi:MAG: hypothetical protein ACFCGT_12980 [Sandaracinaceae bacterium]